MDIQHKIRRAIKRESLTKKSFYEVTQRIKDFAVIDETKQETNMIVTHVYCKRLAGRVQLVGNTPFPFNDLGICKVDGTIGRPQYIERDLKTLLAQNGVSILMQRNDLLVEDDVLDETAEDLENAKETDVQLTNTNNEDTKKIRKRRKWMKK